MEHAPELAPKRTRIKVTRGHTSKHAKQPKRLSAEFVAQAKQELALIDSLQLPEPTVRQVQALLNHALQSSRLTSVLLAFCLVEGAFVQVPEPDKWEKSGPRLRLHEECEISRNQLTLDVRHLEAHHRLIAAVIKHLQDNMVSQYHLIISRRRFTETHSTMEKYYWWQRHVERERDGYYYKVLVDLSQSEPLYELKTPC